MRMLDNCSLETEDVKTIQDDLNYYLESNQEPDFAENELLYDDLHLEDGPSCKSYNNVLATYNSIIVVQVVYIPHVL